jgi:hypothetical protein
MACSQLIPKKKKEIETEKEAETMAKNLSSSSCISILYKVSNLFLILFVYLF